MLPVVYAQLREIAARRMASERAGHTLQPTALVHEAYLRLLGRADIAWNSRAHFFHAAAEAMRRILVDHARSRDRVKRGGGARSQPLHLVDLAASDDPDEILALDEAFRRLEQADARAAEVARLRFFAGLEIEETALALGLSQRTVKREWAFARAWLYQALMALMAVADPATLDEATREPPEH